MLVIPLDRQRRWYRYHHLFRELLRAELERREPALAQELTLRTADWCEANGLPEAAVDYAMAAGDADRAARLVVDLTLPVYYGGRVVTLQRWFDWFDDNDLIKRYLAVAVLGACVHALLGHPVAAERWADAAEHGSSGSLPDGSGPLEGGRGLLGAALCRHGVERMRTDAEVALALAPGDSPLRATLLMLLGSRTCCPAIHGPPMTSWRRPLRWRRAPARPTRPWSPLPSGPSWRSSDGSGARPSSWSNGHAPSLAGPGWRST